ncbi:hypothetical protein GCM10009642_28350 [Nocardiopsis metallicus]
MKTPCRLPSPRAPVAVSVSPDNPASNTRSATNATPIITYPYTRVRLLSTGCWLIILPIPEPGTRVP